MAASIQRHQLNRLCSNPETYERAQSILQLVNAKTRPGSGFMVKSPVAIPSVCAYLASEQLNTGEVSLQSAISAACVTQTEFADILKKVRAALGTLDGTATANVTYEMLVDAYHVRPREVVVACMEDTEAAISRVDILKERYGSHVVSCAIFYWVCQLIEESSVQERALRHAYSLSQKALKAVVTMLDNQCEGVSEQIKSCLLQKRSEARASSPSSNDSESVLSPKKSPLKSAIKTRTMSRITSTPVTTPSKRRAVAFSCASTDHGVNGDGKPFPETPTKKRRVESTPTKSSASNSPAKRVSTAAVAAFHAALSRSPTKRPVGQESESSAAGPSTPRRPRRDKPFEMLTTPVQADSQPSPSRSKGQTSPARPAVRRRFRPVFLEQQQWSARDPKVERMWASTEILLDEMVKLHGHPFQGIGPHEGVVC